MPKTDTADQDIRWDLSSIYSGIDDPRIDLDLAEFTRRAETFCASYKGMLADRLGPAIAYYAELEMLGGKIMVFLFLQQSLDVTNERVKAKVADARKTMSQVQGEYLTFFELELVALDDAVLEPWYARDEVARKHRPWIEQQRVFKPHLLSEPVEAALTKRSPFGPSAWDEFFDECEADLRFEHAGETKNLTEMLDILTTSKDSAERAEVQRAMDEQAARELTVGRASPDAWPEALARMDEARAAVRRKKHLTLIKAETAGAAGAADVVEAGEKVTLVRRALAELSERDREALLLWDAGFNYAEIARQTGLAQGAIGTTLARARKKLVEAFEGQQGQQRQEAQ